MTTRRVTALLAASATLVLVLLAAGCAAVRSPAGGSAAGGSAAGGARPAFPPAAVEKPDLTVAVVPSLDSAGFFIALYGGLFKAQGLHVTFTPAISSDTVIAAQEAGKYDITGGNYVSYFQAQAAGRANLDIIAEGSVMQPGAQEIYTMPDSPIRSLSQLENKTVGINAPDNILYLLAASVLAEHGTPPGQVQFVTRYSLPQLPAELAAGAVDAAVLPEPFASIAEETDGAVPLADLDQGATTNFPVTGYVVTKQWAREYPRTLAAFYTALEQGQQIADTDRAAVEAAMERLPAPLGVSKDTAALLTLDQYPVSSGPAGSVDRVRLQRVIDVMQEFLGFGRSFAINSMLINGGAGVSS